MSLCHSGKCSQERPNAVTPSAWCCRQTRCRPASINLLSFILKPILTSPAPFSSACCSQGWVVIGLPEESLGSVFTGKRGTEIAGHPPTTASKTREELFLSAPFLTVTTVPCPRQTCRSLACILRWNKSRQMQPFSPPTQCYPEDYIWELPRSFIFFTEGSSGIWIVPDAFSSCP